MTNASLKIKTLINTKFNIFYHIRICEENNTLIACQNEYHDENPIIITYSDYKHCNIHQIAEKIFHSQNQSEKKFNATTPMWLTWENEYLQ